MRKTIYIRAVCAISIPVLGILFTMQNCGSVRHTNHVLPPSPFEENKLLFSPEFVAHQKLADSEGRDLKPEAIIPAGTELSVIARDKCLRDRLNDPRRIHHWIDGYITSEIPLGNDSDIFSETAIGIRTRMAFTVAQLNNYAKLDACVVGLSNTTKIAYRAATNPSATASDLLNALEFNSADAIFKAKIPATIKVRVAILDSGLDYNNVSLSSKVDREYDKFYNYLGTVIGVTPSKGNQDYFGLGTQIASLIAGDSGKNFKGLAERNVTLLPIKIRNDINQTFGSYQYLNMIKLAVNMKADVINLATSDVASCDPIVGHAMLQAIRRNVFIVLSAGDNIEPDRSKPRRPGAFLSVKDNGPLYEGNTSAPGCWGRYLKGALTVAASDTQGTNLTHFSNWGEDAVEVAAPGVNIRAIQHNNKEVISDSIVLPTALVTASAVMTIAYHKAMTWSYDPWLIEDIMLNAFPTRSTLSSLIRRGKFLNFSSLANYLQALESKSAEQRLAESSDNAELTGGWNAEAAVDTKLMNVDVYAKNPMLQAGRRIQLNAVAYYTDAVIKVITESGTTFTSSNPAVIEVNSKGVAIAKAPGLATISISYQGKQASTLLSVVGYDVIDGPGNELTNIEVIHDGFNESVYGVCPLVASQGSPLSFSVFANYADGSRVRLPNLSSLAAPDAPEFASFINNSTVHTGNAYGGKTYKVYALYRGKKAMTEVTAPKGTVQKTEMDYRYGQSSPTLTVQDGGTFTITQEKTLIMHPRVVTHSKCRHLPIIGDTKVMRPLEVFSSPDPTLNSKLKALNTSWTDGISLYDLTVGKTYQVNVDYGVYRGTGTQIQLPSKTYYFKLAPADVRDIHLLVSNQPVSDIYPKGRAHMQIQMTDSAGTKYLGRPEQFIAEFYDSATNQRVYAPDAIMLNGSDYSFNSYVYPPVGSSVNWHVSLTHVPTGFKKTFPVKSSGVDRYTGPETSAPQFDWGKFAIVSGSRRCPQGPQTALSGAGTSESPHVVCSSQQLVDLGLKSTTKSTAPHVVLGADIDFSEQILPKKSLLYGSLNGGGKKILNLIYASADETRLFLVSPKIHDVIFSGFSVSMKSVALLGAESIENIYFSNGLVIANDGSAGLMSSANGAFSMGQLRSIKNIRVEGVELQGTTYIAPVNGNQVMVIDNFGTRNLTIRNSSVAGMGSYVGGIVDMCHYCTITSSATHGTIAQVANSVGGIMGRGVYSKLFSVQSSMNIAASTNEVGGLVGSMMGVDPFPTLSTAQLQEISLIMNSSFTGTVRGSRSVGGIAGVAADSTIDTVSVSGSTVVQGTDIVGGIVGSSSFFNKIYDARMDGSVYSSGSVHPIAVAVKPSQFTFRPGDRFSNLRFKGNVINLDPAIVPEPLPEGSVMTVMPAAPPPNIKPATQLGLNISVPGASFANGVYTLNMGPLAKGQKSVYQDVRITSGTPFQIGSLVNGASISFPGGFGTSGSGYTDWSFGVGLPTERSGNISAEVKILLVTPNGNHEVKILVKGVVAQ